MPDGISYNQAKLAGWARRLNEVGDKDLTSLTSRALIRATKKTKAAARANARERLPRRGGLSERVARSRISTRSKLARGEITVQMVAGERSQLQNMDQGRVRHPVWGRRERRWITQQVNGGWWSDAMKENQTEARREFIAGSREVARKF